MQPRTVLKSLFQPLPFSRITLREDDFSKRRRPILIAFFFLEAHFVTASLSVYPMTLGKSPNTRRIMEGLQRKTRAESW